VGLAEVPGLVAPVEGDGVTDDAGLVPPGDGAEVAEEEAGTGWPGVEQPPTIANGINKVSNSGRRRR
jgi:hypothetical protein